MLPRTQRLTFPESTQFTSIPRPAVTLTFDDGFVDDYHITYPELRSRGIKGVFHIVGNTIKGSSGRLSATQINEMATNGMVMASHGYTHTSFVEMTPEQALDEFAASKDAIEQASGKICNQFAAPYNAWNNSLARLSRPFFVAARARGDTIHPYGTALQPNYLRSYAIVRSTTLEEAKAMIDLAIQQRGWTVLMFHQIHPTDPRTADWYLDRFQMLLDYINETGIDVVDLAEGVERCIVYQGHRSENLFVNPDFVITTGGMPSPTGVEVMGDGATVTFTDGQIVVNSTNEMDFMTSVRQVPLAVEVGAEYEFSCEVEVNVTGSGDQSGGVRIGWQVGDRYTPYTRANGQHVLRVKCKPGISEERAVFQVRRTSGTFKFSNPVIRRVA